MGRGKRRHARVPAHVILGVAESATLEELESAHRALAVAYREQGDLEMLAVVDEAYEILSRKADGSLRLVSVKRSLKDLYAALGREETLLVGVRRDGMPRDLRRARRTTAVVAPTSS